MSLLSRATDTFYAFRFLRLLTTPWKETNAFKAGIIDATGNVIKKAETSEDRAFYTVFHRLVFNLKRLLNKVPLGKSTLASYITALYLIKEETNLSDEKICQIISQALNIHSNELQNSIIENIEYKLASGSYSLKHDILYEDFLVKSNSQILVESVCEPIGYIFGFPQYEVLHKESNIKIKINYQDII